MVMPTVHVKVVADTSAAEAGLEIVEGKLVGVGAAAKTADAGLGTTRSRLAQLAGTTSLASAGLGTVSKGFDGVNRSAGLAAAAMRGANPHMVQLGRSTRATGFHTANLTAQFNDIGVMMAAGQSPLILAMQQGTQISQVFQSMGGDSKSAFAAIKAGLMAMISPMAIGTIATIAGAAALFQWATRADEADEAAESLADRMVKAQEASIALNDSLRGLRLGVDENDIVLMDAMLEAQAELARVTAVIADSRSGSTGRAQIAEAQAVLDLATDALQVYRDQVAEKERLTNFARDLSDQERQLGQAMADTATQSQENLNIVDLMKAGITASTVQAMQLAGVDMQSPLTDAANEAARLAEELGISYQTAVNLSLLNARGPASDLRGGRSAGAGGEEVVSQSAMREGFLDQLDPDRNSPTRAPRRSGGGGGNRQTPEEIRAADLELLIESLKTESEVVAEWHQTSMENLDSANDQELTILGGHQAAKERLEAEHQRRLAGMRTGYQGDSLTQASTFFGQMEGALQGSSERMMNIAKVFGAAESLINSYRAYTAVLADPTLPWFARIPAAVGVLSAGLGMVSAIKGVSAGGGGVSTGAAAQSSAPTPAAETGGAPSINRSVTLIGDRGFSREQIEQIIELANEGQENGIRIRGRR
jgi:hypothetical protein